jgi:hypothetical protein
LKGRDDNNFNKFINRLRSLGAVPARGNGGIMASKNARIVPLKLSIKSIRYILVDYKYVIKGHIRDNNVTRM